MIELFGIDLPMVIRSKQGAYPCVMRVPGWVNFGTLRVRSADNGGPVVRQRDRRPGRRR